MGREGNCVDHNYTHSKLMFLTGNNRADILVVLTGGLRGDTLDGFLTLPLPMNPTHISQQSDTDYLEHQVIRAGSWEVEWAACRGDL